MLSHRQTSVWPRLVKEKKATGLVPALLKFRNCSATTGGGKGLAGFVSQKASSGTSNTNTSPMVRFRMRGRKTGAMNFMAGGFVPNDQLTDGGPHVALELAEDGA